MAKKEFNVAKKIPMKKIAIVTGSSGLVGSEACNFLLKKNFYVIGIDNNLRKKLFGNEGNTNWIKKELIKNKNYLHLNTDIRNFRKLSSIYNKYKKKIKFVIHAAAQPSHDWAKKDPILDYHVNSTATLNVLFLTKKYSPNATVIFTSTNKVYGDNPNKIKFKEKKTRFVPTQNKYKKGFDEKLSIDNCTHSFFGASKLSADVIAQEFGKNYSLKVGIFRAGCITGENHSGAELHGFLSYLVKNSLKNKKYKIIGYGGKQVRDNIHSLDLINCFWHFYKNPRKGEIYNIGGSNFSNCSVLEAIEYLENKLKIKIKKKFIKQNRVGDHIWYVSNINKFKKHYPLWKPKFNFEKIMDKLIIQFKKKYE